MFGANAKKHLLIIISCALVYAEAAQVQRFSQAPYGQSIDLAPSPGSEAIGPPFQANYSLNCEAGHGLVGGYRETTADSIQDIAKLVQQAWMSQAENMNATICSQPGSTVLESNVTVDKVCSQVVAGMNYVLLLDATTGCLADNRTIVAKDAVRLAAKVYQPLGPVDAQVEMLVPFQLQEETYEYSD